jgi:hypothetical protein
MFKCKIINFLFFSIPLKRWQDFLIGRHLQRCPLCQNKLASAEEARAVFIQEREGERIASLWPALSIKLGKEERAKESFRRRRLAWLMGAAGLIAVVAASLWLSIGPGKVISKEGSSERFQIHYLRVGSMPARTYLFKPYGSKMIFIWAEKEKPEEESND